MDKQVWVITNPRADVIYGTVEAADQIEAKAVVDGGLADWFWQAAPGPREQLSVHLPLALADGRWREAAPAGKPLPAGDCGGDYQVTEALGRRWWMALPDGTWARFEAAWYVADDTGEASTPVGRVMQRQEEYLICSDLRDAGSSEVWSGYRYEIEHDTPTTEDGVRQAAENFDGSQVIWDGKAF